jgi:major capsid protein
MSLSYHPLNLVQTLEPRTKIYNERDYCILRGGERSSWKPNVSTSYSDTSIQFTAPPPNPKILVDRKVLLNVNALVTLNGNTGSAALLYVPANNNDALRSHALQRIITTQAVTLNNTTVSSNASDVADPLFWYWSDAHKREIDDSLSPCMLDQSFNYADLQGGSRNPLNNYNSSISGADIARGAFPIQVITNTPTQAVLLVSLTDYLYLPPFLSDGKDGPGFIGLQTLDFNFTLGNLSLLWSSFNPSVTSVVATIAGTVSGVTPPPPQLLFNYITPDPLMKVPSSCVYPYYSVQRYPTSGGSIANGVSTTLSSNNIQLKSIPNKIYLFVRRRNADQTYATTNTFLQINGISLDWNNNSGLLSSATPMDLYHMSVQNGLQMSWNQWNSHVGGMMCISFARDICLDSSEAPGMLGTYQLYVELDVTNISGATLNVDFYIVTVSEGTFTITDNSAIANIGVVSANDVLSSINAPEVPYNDLIDQRGGAFFDNIKKFFSDVGQGVKKAYNVGKNIYDKVSPFIAPARMLLGVGRNEGGSYSGGVANSWTEFMHMHKGQGLSKQQLAAMYHRQTGGVISGGDEMMGGVANAWTKFLHKHKGKGYTKAQLLEMYHGKTVKANKSKTVKVGKKGKTTKKCPKGTRKTCVAKGSALYGGELIDRNMMNNIIDRDEQNMRGGNLDAEESGSEEDDSGSEDNIINEIEESLDNSESD